MGSEEGVEVGTAVLVAVGSAVLPAGVVAVGGSDVGESEPQAAARADTTAASVRKIALGRAQVDKGIFFSVFCRAAEHDGSC